MIIRPMEDRDMRAAFDLFDQLIEEARKRDGVPYVKEPFPGRAEALRNYMAAGGAIFLAEEEGKVIGLVTVYTFPLVRRGETRAVVEDLVVDTAWRNKGIGKALLDAAKAFA